MFGSGPSTQSLKIPRIGDGKDDEESSAMEVVAANEDLLIQILLFLPPKSLLRFKSVSKGWLSLISSSRFRLLKSKRFRKDVSGLISRRPGSVHQDFDFFPFAGSSSSPFARLDYVAGDRRGLEVVQSCNGLLLCQSPGLGGASDRRHFVVNPTTKEYKEFTGEFSGNDSGMEFELWQVNLAFDPRKSMHFKLVCIFVWYTEDFIYDEHFEMQVYSSETGLMTHTGYTFDKSLISGVYWNDCINWIDGMDDGWYFNLTEEQFGVLPMPPLHHVEGWDEEQLGRWERYYGESNDHLFLMCTESAPVTQFLVYEMDKGYSGWSLRFCVDLLPVFNLYPDAVNPLRDPSYHLHPNRYCYPFEILGIVDKDDDEGSFIVLTIRGKAIRYNLKDQSFRKICDYATREGLGESAYFPRDSFQFIESFHPL